MNFKDIIGEYVKIKSKPKDIWRVVEVYKHIDDTSIYCKIHKVHVANRLDEFYSVYIGTVNLKNLEFIRR